MSNRFFVGGNWKMNLLKSDISGLLASLKDAQWDTNAIEVVVAPPSCYLDYVSTISDGSNIGISAQNIQEHKSGAFTGEQSAQQVIDVGCQSVILGHSERRHVFDESDERIAAKVRAALDSKLRVILCVGETDQQRVDGETLQVVTRQLESVRAVIGDDAWKADNIVIAYEPVWAIGTGKTATPEIAQDVHAQIRDWLSDNVSSPTVRIIYGGSVKPANAAKLSQQKDIDGFLVGGASLKADLFLGVINNSKISANL